RWPAARTCGSTSSTPTASAEREATSQLTSTRESTRGRHPRDGGPSWCHRRCRGPRILARMNDSDGHVVARIGKPHALRGEVTVQLHTDDPQSRFVPGVVFETRAAAGSGVPRQLTLATTRVHRGIW